MKTLSLILLFICGWGLQAAIACDVCQKNQPKVLENITHGVGPQGTLDFVITWSAVVIVVLTLFFSIKYLIRPKEQQLSHIKNVIVNENY